MSKGIEQDVAFIQALAQLIRDSDLTEIEVEREYGEDDELKVRLSRAPAAPAAPVYVTSHPGGHQMQTAPMQPQVPQQPPSQPAAAAAETPDLTHAVTSPMVGTAYLAAEPGADPFVSVGDQVAEGQTILIIEAMKTMNQIPAPRGGRVRAILVENAEPVEFGEPLMIIE
jgi:acetyl-CoA carboxylase biotin carboxyl carrier protein